MSGTVDDRRPPRRALLVVRNPFEHDARVLRAGRKLLELGFEVTVLAALGEDPAGAASRREERRGAIKVVRVGPPPALRRLYARARSRLGGHASGLRGERGGVDGGSGRSPGAAEPAPEGSGGLGAGAAHAKGLLRRLGRWARTADFYARAIPIALRERADLVHCNDYNTMWVGLAVRVASPRTALVYDSHEIWADRNLRPEARWWLLLCEFLFVRVAHAVVMTSPAHAEVLARRNRIALPTVVRNIPSRVEGSAAAGAPSDDAAAQHDARGERSDLAAASGQNGRVAIYVGGLLRHRGLEQSIRALPRLEQLRLRLLGPVAPDYRYELEALARDAAVADRVEFAPPVPPTEVVDALSHADVGLALFQPVCLSHRLVLPNKLFEYAHAGLPVVGSDLPMIARFVDEHGVGAVVDPEDPEAIAAALAEVLDPAHHPRLRAAARRAGEALDWERESELLADVYRRALERAGA